MESDDSEAGDEDIKLVGIEVELATSGLGLLRFKRSLRMQLKLISQVRMVARVSGV